MPSESFLHLFAQFATIKIPYPHSTFITQTEKKGILHGEAKRWDRFVAKRCLKLTL